MLTDSEGLDQNQVISSELFKPILKPHLLSQFYIRVQVSCGSSSFLSAEISLDMGARAVR